MNDLSSSSSQTVDAVIIGAGFGGLYALHKLRGLGFSVQGFETAEDVGGTWFWNRYPGARCDVESVDYSYSFDPELERDWTWTERFATQPEILRYLQHVADRYDLRPLIRFNTRVAGAMWSEERGLWRITTEQGGNIEARFLIMATGSLSAAKAPDIEGLDDFNGRILHTANWPDDVSFSGQRVGVIGTGSSGIQAIPMIAKEAARLTVLQRTPSFTIPARNAPLSADYIAEVKANYAERRRVSNSTVVGTPTRTTGKNALSVDPETRKAAYEDAWAHGGPLFAHTFVDLIRDRDANDTAADFVRGKIAEIVKDPATAEALMPRGFPLGSKRVAVDTDYYATFNRDNVDLVDLRKTPLQRIVADGVETSAGVVPLDTLVLATGFDALTGSFLRVAVSNGAGTTLREKWSAGPRTYLGLMTAGFPNLFFVAGPGSPSVLSNMVASCEHHVDFIAGLLVKMRDEGSTVLDVDVAAEDQWVERTNALAARTLYLSGDSWYLGANVPGKPRVFMPYCGGVSTYRSLCSDIVAADYPGFVRERAAMAQAS